MSLLQRYRAPSMGHLLSSLLESSDLPTLVRELPAAALAKVIDHVGLEDAGEIVALASSEQLGEVFDEDLWKRGDADVEERFDPQRFALWLAILSEGGDELVARCLRDMPEDLLTLGVERLLWVLDMDALTSRLSGDESSALATEKALGMVVYEEWEEFALIARDAATWDVVWNGLLALDRDHHDLLRRVLERCVAVSQHALDEYEGLAELLSEEGVLEGQVLDERDERRSSRGYVSSADARAFLKLCRMEGDRAARDPITLAYFRRLSSSPDEARASRRLAPGARLVGEAWGSEQEGASLRQLLEDAGVVGEERVSHARPALLAGEDAEPSLKRLLVELREVDASLAGQRLAELAYLANVLIAAATKEATRRPMDALRGVLSIVEAGIATWPTPPAHESSTVVQDRALEVLKTVSADRLFRRGVQAILTSPSPASPAVQPWLSILASQ